MIYTRTGDSGTTSLVGGSRTSKDDVRVEAYGTLDELNSYLGLLATMLEPSNADQHAQLKRAQNNLFTIQTLLATEDAALYARLPQLAATEVELLEHTIDQINASLPRLNGFVIAGGTTSAALAHVCRTVCRRAERRTVTLSHAATVDPTLLCYLNRLSDYLFVLSRLLVAHSSATEELYISRL